MYLQIVLMNGHVESCVHFQPELSAFSRLTCGTNVHEHEHTHVGKEMVLVNMSI